MKPRVSILIKALNEERRIAAAVSSAIEAARSVGGEVVLADSLSVDQTVAIAARYPIHIVQLEDASSRSCAAGAQLAFQHAVGEFVFLMDGDMELNPAFLPEALEFLAAHPEFVGVGGRITELNEDSLEYRSRSMREGRTPQIGEVDRLNGGGLYRREVLERVGFLARAGLFSYEEYDLGRAIRQLGYRLYRLGTESVRHEGHRVGAFTLLIRRLRSGYIYGLGQVLAGAIAARDASRVFKDVPELRIYATLLLFWAGALSIGLATRAWMEVGAVMFLVLTGATMLMAARRRSLAMGIYSIVSWHANAGALLVGATFLYTRSRRIAVGSRVVQVGCTSFGNEG